MKKISITDKKRFTLFVGMIVASLIFGAYEIVKHRSQVPAIEKMNISDASKVGEKKVVQLLVQIAPSSSAGGGNGRLERGDVLLSAPEDKQFSIAEQEGFLIIKARLTEAEQQLLETSLKQQNGIFASEQERRNTKIIKMRKFAVDLDKIGIAEDQTIGKVFEEKVFDDDIFVEKK